MKHNTRHSGFNKHPKPTTHTVAHTPLTTPTLTTPTVKKRTEVTTAFKPKLILTEQFLKQVNFLHKKVKLNTEWSAILLYTNKEGTIDNAESWVISVDDLILMDIGTSAYTEYDMEADDAYATDKWMGHLEKGGKIGHLHTHHNMSCYFSGTDMGELHDNAPQHNYYLSLIVNYKDPSQWCARVAICGTEVTEGEIKVTKSWKGAKGPMSKVDSDSLKETKEMLYLMDCVLEEEVSSFVEQGVIDRLKEIEDKKEAERKASLLKYPTYHNRPHIPTKPIGASTVYSSPGRLADDELDEWNHIPTSTGFNKPTASVGATHTTTDVKQANDFSLSTTQPKPGVSIVGRFTPKVVEPLLLRILNNSMLEPKHKLETTMMELEILNYSDLVVHMNKCEESAEAFMELWFGKELTDIHRHAIANSMFSLLKPFEVFTAYDFIDTILIGFLLGNGEYSTDAIRLMTGLVAADQVELDTKD